jgi:WD repeat-containing protein mio
MVWDRRATSRPVASHTYIQAVEDDDIPWGGALRLDRAIDTDSAADGKHSLIRSLRYCRDHRGLLAVLSRTGQLRVLETNKETLSAHDSSSQSPELLQVRKSHEMDVNYSDASRRHSQIVSFDWVTLGSPALKPRLLVLRSNGSFEILEQPSEASDHVFKLVPWQAPYRGLEGKALILSSLHG